ncbi:MAG TPA: hypothetical protein VNW15_16615 [Rhizomicrobium sp.]|jgi:hypothetical protein|nr:hypothetical protein [Rhizomicrobium sp.]
MGIARLLAKAWVVFCLFAGAHALRIALASGVPLPASGFAIGICVLLFAAMGLLFAGGFGVAGGATGTSLLDRLKPAQLIPGFNEIVFMIFLILSFVVQVFFAPQVIGSGLPGDLESAIYFAVPGQRALVYDLAVCSMDGGRLFAASFTWLLAIVYLGSALSRLKLAAGIMRLERAARPEILGPTLRAFLLGIMAVVGIQFLFVGSAYPWFACSAFTDITGALLIGLFPLMLAYLIVAALASLLAASPES